MFIPAWKSLGPQNTKMRFLGGPNSASRRKGFWFGENPSSDLGAERFPASSKSDIIIYRCWVPETALPVEPVRRPQERSSHEIVDGKTDKTLVAGR